MTTGAWVVETQRGTTEALHALDHADGARRVWIMELRAPSLVLGSTQSTAVVNSHEASCEVVSRRSGGGAVLLNETNGIWIDVIVPRGDALWDDDVNRSFFWLGDTWARALAALGLEAAVHRGALERTPWSRLVCFAGIGPGEVTVEGRKAVGLSQRRTRLGARFQCVLYTGVRPGVADIVDLLAEPKDPQDRMALRAHLDATTASVPVQRGDAIVAFLAALPTS